MTYSINLTNGTTLIPGGLSNGTLDQTATDLTLIGQNATSYGQFLNDNFVHLLENFANTSAPPNPIKGELWYDTSQNLLQIYNLYKQYHKFMKIFIFKHFINTF